MAEIIVDRRHYTRNVVKVTFELTRHQAAELGYTTPDPLPFTTAPPILLTMEIDTGLDDFRALMQGALKNKGGAAKSGPLRVRRGGPRG